MPNLLHLAGLVCCIAAGIGAARLEILRNRRIDVAERGLSVWQRLVRAAARRPLQTIGFMVAAAILLLAALTHQLMALLLLVALISVLVSGLFGLL